VKIRARASSRPAPGSDIRSVADGLQKWLDVCEKEGRDGRDPVTAYTLKHYEAGLPLIGACFLAFV